MVVPNTSIFVHRCARVRHKLLHRIYGNLNEPFAAHHPIKDCEQVVLTPHAADQTPEGVELLNEGAVDNVIAFLEGRPNNNVAAP